MTTTPHTEECEHDYNNPVRKGRAHLCCRKCDKNITLELVLMHEANEHTEDMQGWKERFDEQYTSMGLGEKWRPGMVYTPSMIKSFFTQELAIAREEGVQEGKDEAVEYVDEWLKVVKYALGRNIDMYAVNTKSLRRVLLEARSPKPINRTK